MSEKTQKMDKELLAMKRIAKILADLTPGQRARVLTWNQNRCYEEQAAESRARERVLLASEGEREIRDCDKPASLS